MQIWTGRLLEFKVFFRFKNYIRTETYNIQQRHYKPLRFPETKIFKVSSIAF